MGYGIGHVVIYIAKKGLCVIGVNIINYYFTKVKRNIKEISI